MRNLNTNTSIWLFAAAFISMTSIGCRRNTQEAQPSKQLAEREIATPPDSSVQPTNQSASVAVKIKQVSVSYNKPEIEKMMDELTKAEARKPNSPDLTVRPAPTGKEVVTYRGVSIFEAQEILKWEAHSSGNVMLLGKLEAKRVVRGADPNVDAEGSAGEIDPIGVWLAVRGQYATRVTAENAYAINALFSPTGTKLAVSEIIRDEQRTPLYSQVRVVDTDTGRSFLVNRTDHSNDHFFVAKWESESRLQVVTVGEASYDQAAMYEIP